jgi:hypothetical protein
MLKLSMVMATNALQISESCGSSDLTKKCFNRKYKKTLNLINVFTFAGLKLG